MHVFFSNKCKTCEACTLQFQYYVPSPCMYILFIMDGVQYHIYKHWRCNIAQVGINIHVHVFHDEATFS